MRFLRNAIVVASAAAAMLSALSPATGQAAPEGDATIRVAPFNVQQNQISDGQAFCPPGSRLVGGGVTKSNGLSTSLVQVSGPFDETGLTSNLTDGDVGRSWYAKVYNLQPNIYVSTAICSAGSDATIRATPFPVDAGQTGSGEAFCLPGSRVVGGGVTGTGTAFTAVRASGPLDETGVSSNLADGDVGRSWYASVFNGGPGQSTFVSIAICSPGSDATIRVAPFTAQQNQTGFGQAFCPPGSRVVGGGVTSTASTDQYLQASGPLDETGLTSNLNDGDVGLSWFADVQNYGPGPNTNVATAICAPSTPTTAREVQTCKGEKATIAARPGALGRAFKGSSNPDVIVGTSGRDKINAGAGTDLVCAGAGKDTVKGGSGKDRLFGEGGKDKLLGQGGKDLLAGGAKNDTCVGGPGNDAERSC